jgi:hypothetical protein
MNSNVTHSFDDESGSDDVGRAAGGISMGIGMAAGGMAAGGMGSGIYTDDDVDTKNQDALTAAMTRLNKSGKTAGIKAN